MVQSLIVNSINDETTKIRSFVLCAKDNSVLQSYTAGSHIDLDLAEFRTRSYSLIDWHRSEEPISSYTIAVQREDDGRGGSKAMHALEQGQAIAVSNPTNDFELKAFEGPVLLLAGGIGVTPLISMATELTARKIPFAFHYSGRSKPLMGFTERLEKVFPNQLSIHCDDQNPLDLNALMQIQSNDTQIYICGPKGMIEAAKNAAITAKLPKQNVHIELFTAPDAKSDDVPFEVEIHNTGDVYTVPAGRTIIDVLEEAGIDVMFDCQRGDCGICQTNVISGIPDHRDVVLSESDKTAGKIMQICVSRAKSARLVLDI